jgi:beta-xylosidase
MTGGPHWAMSELPADDKPGWTIPSQSGCNSPSKRALAHPAAEQQVNLFCRDTPMKKLIPLILLIFAAVSVKTFGQSNTMANPIRQTTFCNPLNLDYRFCLDNPSRREAADPTLVVFRDEYYLFASKSGGYWHSTDLIQWDLITSRDLPLEDYAPTALIMHDTLYFMASADKPVIYKTADPKSGKWARVREFPFGVTDPCLFLDDDGRLFLY